MTPSPFQYLRSVEPEMFVGRWPLVRRIALDLTLDNGDSHAIIGGRRCGKSSLLSAIAYQLRQMETLNTGDWVLLPVSFDFKSGNFDSAKSVLVHLLAEVRRRVDQNVRRRPPDAWLQPVALNADWFERLASAEQISLRELEDCLGYILDQLEASGQSIRIGLLLDEVDETVGHSWTEELFNLLRALIYSGDLRNRIRLVIAGSHRFLDQVSSRGSPLWNILKLHYLDVFDETGFQQLVARAEGISDSVVAATWRQSGGQPFLAQYILYHLWESRLLNSDSDTVNHFASDFLHEQAADIEGWANAVGVSGLHTYGVLSETPDWIEEREILHRINDSSLNVKHGLIALCYNGLATHDSGWQSFKCTGFLFKTWFDRYGSGFLAKLITPQQTKNTPDSKYQFKADAIFFGPNAYQHKGDQYIKDSANFAIGSSVSIQHGLTAEEVALMFGEIYKAIERRPNDPSVEREEIEETVKKIEAEAAKGEKTANQSKIERLVKTLKVMAPDILEVAIATWTNPVSAVSLMLKKIADKAKSEASA